VEVLTYPYLFITKHIVISLYYAAVSNRIPSLLQKTNAKTIFRSLTNISAWRPALQAVQDTNFLWGYLLMSSLPPSSDPSFGHIGPGKCGRFVPLRLGSVVGGWSTPRYSYCIGGKFNWYEVNRLSVSWHLEIENNVQRCHKWASYNYLKQCPLFYIFVLKTWQLATIC
jgi:hypothetical protein